MKKEGERGREKEKGRVLFSFAYSPRRLLWRRKLLLKKRSNKMHKWFFFRLTKKKLIPPSSPRAPHPRSAGIPVFLSDSLNLCVPAETQRKE